MNRADVAIVMVTYRSADLAIESLRSIQAERERSLPNIRVVVVDNASGDHPRIRSAIEANGWSTWVTPLLAAQNGGFAYGNNLGIKAVYESARPDFVHLLNPDTLVRPGAIATLVGFLQRHPDVGIAGGSFETEDGADWPFAFRFPSLLGEVEHGLQIGLATRCLARWTVPRTMSREAQPADWICGASMLIRAQVLESIGGLDESYFLYYEETEFCHRARLAGFPTWYVPESRVMHIIGKSTTVSEDARLTRRLPDYWFASRTRYLVSTRGTAYAALADVAAIASGAVGLLKKTLARQPITPHYLRDLVAHSVLLPGNRRLLPARVYFPPRQR